MYHQRVNYSQDGIGIYFSVDASSGLVGTGISIQNILHKLNTSPIAINYVLVIVAEIVREAGVVKVEISVVVDAVLIEVACGGGGCGHCGGQCM